MKSLNEKILHGFITWEIFALKDYREIIKIKRYRESPTEWNSSLSPLLSHAIQEALSKLSFHYFSVVGGSISVCLFPVHTAMHRHTHTHTDTNKTVAHFPMLSCVLQLRLLAACICPHRMVTASRTCYLFQYCFLDSF